MRRSTMIGFFVGMLALTMNAQVTQSSTSRSTSGTSSVENQKKPAPSIQELLTRYNNLGSRSGSVSEHFTREEQQLLKSYFNSQKREKSNNVVNGNGKISANVTSAVSTIGTAGKKIEYVPLFVLQDAVTDGSHLANKPTQFIYQDPFIYGARDSGIEKQKPTVSLEDLLLRLQSTENQKEIDAQQFSPAERQVLSSYFKAKNSGNRGPQATLLDQGFEDITTLPGAGYSFVNASDTPGSTNWFQGNETVFPAQSGAPTAYIGANFNNTAGSVINNFMITPVLNLENGDEITFWTRTPTASTFPDRLEVRLDPTGANTDPSGPASVGSYTELLLEINPTLVTGVYPDVWTEFTVTVSGLTGATDTRVAFRYWVTNGGPLGSNSDYIGIDTLTIEEGAGGGGGCSIVSDCNLSDVTPDDATSSDIWDRPFADGTCCSASGPVSYDVYGPFTVDTSGLYTIDSDQDGGTWDGYLFLYETCFDPLDQTTNFVAGDDDGPGGIGTSQILDINLSTGTEYYIITTGFGAGDFGAFTTTISGVGTATCGGGGGGTACSESNPSNNFENGFTSSTNTTQVIATDITVDADTNFSLESIQANWLVFDGEVIVSADITIYGDLAGLPNPANVIATIPGVVPTSQAVIGDFPANPVLDVLGLNFDITPEMLNGQAGVTTTYWISIYVTNTTANGSFWEFSTATSVGNDGAFSPDNGATWGVALPGSDQVYEFSGQCEAIGGGGGVLDTAYGVNNGNFELIGFPVSDPSTVEVFGDSPVTVNFENAGAIDPANPRTGYVLDNGGQFYSFDVESGFYTLLGNIPGDWIGMEYDQASGILYAIAGADLYTIDPVAVSATLVGATGIPPGNLPIALAIDGAGVGYTYELVTDNLYSIDLATATATLIGNIGFDANFGQGMCYDALTDTVYMAAFNSASFAAEWRSVNLTTGASTLIGPIVTDAATTQVAWVSIGETLPPPACPEPTNLAVTNIAPDSADLSWTAEPNASNGYIWYVFVQGDNPVSDPPVATGTVPAGTTTATATGLSGGVNYDFYVVADCDTDGLSQLAGPVTFATPPSCGGKFYDTGGPGANYQDNENVTTVINPANSGEQVTVTFTAFDVESTWDALYVYDGPDTSSPLISSGNPPTNSGFPAGGFYGTSIIGPFTSSHPSGALTFVFLSDSSVPRAGWEADVTCALSPPPNDRIVNSIDVDELGVPYTDPGVHMPAATTEDGNPQGCDLTGANGVWYNFVAAGDGTAVASIVTPGGASSVTFYTAPDETSTETELVLVPQNSNQCAPGTSTSIFTLAGQTYYVFVLNTGAITDIVIDGTNLGVSENTIDGFSYYPNPTNGILNLKSVENIESVSLYNLLGQLVIDNKVNATTSLVDISGLSTGTYLMRVTVNGQIGTYRVLKQ